MKARVATLVGIGIIVAAIGLWQFSANQKNSPTTFQASTDETQTTVIINGVQFSTEIAESEEDKATGLSFREQIAKRAAMLFIFDEPTKPTFWMREMKFPLDIIWISGDFKIVDITKNAPIPKPGTLTEELPLYSPKTEAKYVLEINAGESESFKIGDTVQILRTNEQ